MTVTLLLDDTLQETGLRYLLRQYFDIDAATAGSVDESTDTPSSIYFVSPGKFTSSLDFFLPRRSRTAILDSSITHAHNESVIVEHLDIILKSLEQRHPDTAMSAELSQREIEVLSLVAKGLINKEIADRLNISFNTVLSHRKNITAKLGIKSVSGLSVYAIMNGYISEGDLHR